MKLKSFKYLIGLLVIMLFSPLLSEEKIDIWKNNSKKNIETSNSSIQTTQENNNTKSANIIESPTKIQIEENNEIIAEKENIYGIFEPANYDLNLNMWSNTKAEDLRSSLKRLEKIKLSKSSEEILEIILFSFSYPPPGMSEKEFVSLKIDWLIKNEKIDLIESFLKQNQEFESKSRAVQFLVDQNIASANIKEGCNKIKFIDAKIKDPYLEKFKIYCLVFNKKKFRSTIIARSFA